MQKYTKKELFKIEKSIIFLVKYVTESNSNPKPLILHSVNVGTKLLELKIPLDIVVAGFLHDVVEDTKCTNKKIEKEFGKKVSRIVSALTQDYKYKYYKDRWRNAEKRINKIGKYCWLIKMIDARDNLPYYSTIIKKKLRISEMMWKYKLVIRNSKKKNWSQLDEFKSCNSLVNEVKKKWKV
ncbi:MAG: HD domain-containing protein [Candidatus Kerfeldbacteria bacterium]